MLNVKTGTVLLLSLILLLPAKLSAQTDRERRFMNTADSLNRQYLAEYRAGNYGAAENICCEIIGLYDRYAAELSDGFVYFKYSSCYNLACVQAKQGKRKEAALNLAKVLDSGKLELNYRALVNDTDLAGILDMKELQPALDRFKEASDYLLILKKAPEYSRNQTVDSLPAIVYAGADDPDLVRVREYFHLDRVAVPGDELATIKNVLTYVHDRIRHDGKNGTPGGGANSINYAEACRDGRRGLNCRGLATVLNECYLSLGIPSRVITCLPKTYISDCHVINSVYSSVLGKWLWVDPTNNAWVMDDQGNMLSIQEVRERLRTDQPVMLNEEANWNNERKTTTEDYLYNYMAKNLYYLESWTRYGFNTESDAENPVNYIFLQPVGCDSSERKPRNFSVNDDRYFWQLP